MTGSADQTEAAAFDVNITRTNELREAIMALLRTEMRSTETRSEAAKEEDLFAIVAALADCAGRIMRHSSATQLLKEMHAATIDEWTA